MRKFQRRSAASLIRGMDVGRRLRLVARGGAGGVGIWQPAHLAPPATVRSHLPVVAIAGT